MQLIKSTPARGFLIQAIAGLVALLAVSANAQKYSQFDEHPSERSALVARLAKQAADDRKEAREWAKANGKKERFEANGVLYELAAVRNGKPLYYKTLNSSAAISTAANKVRGTSPYSVSGSGVKVGVWDGGSVFTSHQEVVGRVTVKDGTPSSHYHATHVGGTIIASGVVSSAKGMASSATIDSYDWFSDRSEMAGAAATAPGQPQGLYLSNHSYGYAAGWEKPGSTWEFNGFEVFGQYHSYSVETDQFVYNSQYYLPFWSAGNDRGDSGSGSPAGDGAYKLGYDTISHNAIAKNVMTVGAVNDAVAGTARSTVNATMASFSSWGPADDGRIKPDIVANGVGLYSCYNGHAADYSSMSGTSMSSPNACGSAALLIDYYDNRFPGQAMRASTLKGLIIHTADNLGRPGPDYQYGWGLMNTLAAAELIKNYAEGNAMRMTEATLANNNKSDSYTVFSDGSAPLRVTLCWTDPAGPQQSASDSRTPVLVNDLDLKITGPSGTIYPYKLDVENPSANATTGENHIDNVEQVYIATPVAGSYTITVDTDEVTLSGNTQWYSLLTSGISADTDGDGLSDGWESMYFASPTGAVAAADSDGDGASNWEEYVAGTNPTNSASVFKISTHQASAGGAPFIIKWTTVPGRLYSVGWTYNLVYVPFENNILASNLAHTINSYTDTVQRAQQQIFYRVEVKPGQ